MDAVHRLCRNGGKYEIWYTTISDGYGTVIELSGDIPVSAIEELVAGETEITPQFACMALELCRIYKPRI